MPSSFFGVYLCTRAIIEVEQPSHGTLETNNIILHTMDLLIPNMCSRSYRSSMDMNTIKIRSRRLGGDIQPVQLRLIKRPRHPFIIGTAALSLLATALPSSAFAATTGVTNTFGLSTNPLFARPLFVRGGQSSMSSNMSNKQKYSQAPPAPAISPFSRPIKRVTVVGGTHGNECK